MSAAPSSDLRKRPISELWTLLSRAAGQQLSAVVAILMGLGRLRVIQKRLDEAVALFSDGRWILKNRC